MLTLQIFVCFVSDNSLFICFLARLNGFASFNVYIDCGAPCWSLCRSIHHICHTLSFCQNVEYVDEHGSKRNPSDCYFEGFPIFCKCLVFIFNLQLDQYLVGLSGCKECVVRMGSSRLSFYHTRHNFLLFLLKCGVGDEYVSTNNPRICFA